MIKKIVFLLVTLAVVVSSCNNSETYSDKKEKERNAIAKFISDRKITVINEDQFKQQGETTDVSKNELINEMMDEKKADSEHNEKELNDSLLDQLLIMVYLYYSMIQKACMHPY